MSHTPEDTLAETLIKAKEILSTGDIYHHYTDKDKHYEILAVALKEDSETVCVVYRALYGRELIWVRDFDTWISYVTTPSGRLPRFQKV